MFTLWVIRTLNWYDSRRLPPEDREEYRHRPFRSYYAKARDDELSLQLIWVFVFIVFALLDALLGYLTSQGSPTLHWLVVDIIVFVGFLTCSGYALHFVRYVVAQVNLSARRRLPVEQKYDYEVSSDMRLFLTSGDRDLIPQLVIAVVGLLLYLHANP